MTEEAEEPEITSSVTITIEVDTYEGGDGLAVVTWDLGSVSQPRDVPYALQLAINALSDEMTALRRESTIEESLS